MRMRDIGYGMAMFVLASGVAVAQPSQSRSAMEKPLHPLPASADVTPGSNASGEAPTAYALPAEEFRLWAGKNKAFQIAVSQLALRMARAPETRAYAAHLYEQYARGFAAQHNIADTPSGEAATLTDAQRTILALLGNAGKDFDRLFLAQQIDSQRAAQGIAQSFAVGGIGGLSRMGAAQAVTTTQTLISEAEDALAKLMPATG